jgi:hypothetical protein
VGDLLVKARFVRPSWRRSSSSGIASDNAQAAYGGEGPHDIQVSQNQSDIETAQRKLQFAEMDLRKYKEGDLEQLRKEAEDKILLARQKRTQAETTLKWSKTLFEKGFIMQTELDRDDLEFQSSDVQLKQAELALELLQKYDNPRKQSELETDLAEAAAGPRALQAKARIADFLAALTTSEARWQLGKQKYRDQIERTKIIRPWRGWSSHRTSGYGRRRGRPGGRRSARARRS